MVTPPSEFVQAIATLTPNRYLARLLWQRGQRDLDSLQGFLDCSKYRLKYEQPIGFDSNTPKVRTSEIRTIVDRIKLAIQSQESIALCTNALSGGIVIAALLSEGLADLARKIQIFDQCNIDELKIQGIQLVIVCSLISQNNSKFSDKESIDCIIIPTVPIAYQILERLQVPHYEQLLDLVAIGILSDWIEITSDIRYLFQTSIPKLQAQSDIKTTTRLSIHHLLTYCKQQGDRATDFNLGLGSRIRALSQIDPQACLALLTTQDKTQAKALADQAELASRRLLALHQELLDQVLPMVRALDLAEGEAIVLFNEQWSLKALPSVAAAIGAQFDRPVFLLTTGMPGIVDGVSYSDFDLYDTVNDQQHLITGAIGPACALRLSLPKENLEIFTQAIQHQLRLRAARIEPLDRNRSDLSVTIEDLGESLYEAIRAIEPCGPNNPVPRLLLNNVQFDQVSTRKLQDHRYQSIIYRAIEFKLVNSASSQGIYGNGWGFTQDELPKGLCNAIVQLENNVKHRRYEVRLLQWFRCSETNRQMDAEAPDSTLHPIIDLRGLSNAQIASNSVKITACPSDWNTLQIAYRQSCQLQQPLVLNYQLPKVIHFTTLLGIAKYLARTGDRVSPRQWCDRLSINASTLQIGLEILRDLGFSIVTQENGLQISRDKISPPNQDLLMSAAKKWERSVRELRFRQQYFMQVSLSVLQAFL